MCNNFDYHLHQSNFYHENNFARDMSFALFDTIFLLRADRLLSKSVFFTKFASAILALNVSVANLLNSVVVIYLFSISLLLVS